MSDWTDKDYAEAAAFLRALRPITADEWASLTELQKAQAFTVSRVVKLELIQQFLDEMADAVARGLTPQEFAAEAETLDLGISDAQIEQVFSENIQRAFGAGEWDYAHSSTASLWGWKYHSQEDDRVRFTHALLDAAEFELDGRGDAVFPPWNFGCRCYATWIAKDVAPERESEIPPDVQAEMLNTSYVSPAIQNEYAPDLTNYDPRLLSQYANDQALVS